MKPSALDLNLLVAFDSLASEGSVTRAASRLHMSQPAMSGALARLRSHFGDPLFVRKGGQMRPTVRAQQLARPIADAIAALREALEPDARFRPETSSRSFVIAASDYVEAIHFGRLTGAVQREAPGVSIRVLRPPQAFWPPRTSCGRERRTWRWVCSPPRFARARTCWPSRWPTTASSPSCAPAIRWRSGASTCERF